METKTDTSIKALIKAVLVMAIVIISIIVLPTIVSCMLPFFLAWLMSHAIKPIIALFEKVHINRRIAVVVSMLLVVSIAGGVIYGVSTVIVKEAKDVAQLFKDTKDGIPLFVWDVLDALPGGLKNIGLEMVTSIRDNSTGIASSAFQSVLPRIGGFAGKLPGALVFLVVFLISLYFMSYDAQSFKDEVRRLVTEEKYMYIRNIKNTFSMACGGYIRAQLIIMAVVFCILLIGFLIMDVRFALLLAFVISLIDAIPVLGTGIILNSWAVLSLLQGNYVLAAGLVCLYVVILITRQFIEPRILSGQLGIHPLITLISMYCGLKLVGIAGMILGPLTTLVVINFIKVNEEISRTKEGNQDAG